MSWTLLRVVVLSAALLMSAEGNGAGERRWDTDILRDTFGYGPETPTDAPWEEVQQGCGGRDCIPSIDEPRFVAAGEAGFIADDDVVLGIELNGESRAYPIAILNYHEIVNDEIGGRAVAITYCPLCGSGIAFDRTFDGQAVELGVSGLLRNNDLILYDRATESLWQQITAQAFAGPLRGQTLTALPVSMSRWSEWRQAHPDTRVLSTDTGFDKPYTDKAPYGDYDTSERLLFPMSFDRKLHPKAVVYGVELDGAAFAVTEEAIRTAGIIKQPGEPGVRWQLKESGEVLASRNDTGESIVAHRMFWFAWYSFHTGTQLYAGAAEN